MIGAMAVTRVLPMGSRQYAKLEQPTITWSVFLSPVSLPLPNCTTTEEQPETDKEHQHLSVNPLLLATLGLPCLPTSVKHPAESTVM